MNSIFCFLSLLFITGCSQDRVIATTEVKTVPVAVLEASSFITDFHKRKFAANAFDKISVPYLSSINEDDIADLSFLNTMSSIFSTSFAESMTNDAAVEESNDKSNSSSVLQQPQPLPSPKKHVENINDTNSNDTNAYKNLDIDNETLSLYMTMRRKKKVEGYIVFDNLRLQCNKYDYTGSPSVEVVVDIKRFDEVLLSKQELNRTDPASCVLVMFYAGSCPFSAMAAPHFNALARTFPMIKMVAIDSREHQIVNSQYGIIGVPTVMLFHNGRPSLKYNQRRFSLKELARFLMMATDFEANSKMFVASTDFGGPLSSIPKPETDVFLYISAVVFFVSFLYYIFQLKTVFLRRDPQPNEIEAILEN